MSDSDGEHTKELKQKAREEWFRLVSRTREMTPDLKMRIEKNKIFICERHFKAECILTGKLLFVWCSVNYLAYTAHCDEHLIVCSLKLYSICIFLIGVRTTLFTRSIPTENLPEKGHTGFKHLLTEIHAGCP